MKSIERAGLTEKTALKHRIRLGYYPETYVNQVDNSIPEHMARWVKSVLGDLKSWFDFPNSRPPPPPAVMA